MSGDVILCRLVILALPYNVLNLLSVGAIVDCCRQKSENDKNETVKGLTETPLMLATFSTLMEIFTIFRNKWVAHLAVALVCSVLVVSHHCGLVLL